MTPLRKRLIEDMTVRNLAPTTQATYVQQVSMFARYFGRSPETLGAEEIRSYQVYLAMEKKLAPSSISTAVAALRSSTTRHSRSTGYWKKSFRRPK